MTRMKSTPTPRYQVARKLEVFCIGECGRSMSITVDEGVILKKIEYVCAPCEKTTKYNMPTASASKVVGLPPGQTALPSETEKEAEDE